MVLFRPVLAAACLGALALATACRRDAAPDTSASTGTVVTSEAARLETLRDVATASGVIVPASSADLTVFATETSEVVELPKKEQDVVAIGDVLVKFEIASLTQEMAALQLEVLDAQSRLDRARSELTRQTALVERGITSRNAYDASRVEASTAENLLQQAKTRFESAQSSQDRAVVRARFPGTVYKVWHAPGDTVRPGADDPILRVIDPARVQVSVQLPVAQLARIVPGQAATVTAIAGAGPEAAQVAAKMPSLDASAPTGEIRLAFVNPATLPLETPVSTEILLDQRTNALVVPAAAVGRDGLGAYVMIAGDDLKAHRRDVRLGLVTKTSAQITAGLSAGERVIVSGLTDVADGGAIVLSR